MHVRYFQNDDDDTFLRLCEEFYSSGATNRGFDRNIAEKTFERVIDKHENLWGVMLIDKDTDEEIGYGLITSYWCNEDGGNVILIDELYVSKDYRHKGYGHLFMKWVEETFRDQAVAVTLEVLTTNTEARSLYDTAGFKFDGFENMTKRLD